MILVGACQDNQDDQDPGGSWQEPVRSCQDDQRGAAERGHGKVERGHRWGRGKLSVVTDGTAGKRSAWSHFCPYRIRITSHI